MSWLYFLLMFYLGGFFCRFMESFSWARNTELDGEEIEEIGPPSPGEKFLVDLILSLGVAAIWPFHLTYETDKP